MLAFYCSTHNKILDVCMPSCHLKKDVLKRVDKKNQGQYMKLFLYSSSSCIPYETHSVTQVRHVCHCVNTVEEETRYDI